MELPHSTAKDSDTRERLSQLEHRVGELERAAERQRRAKRRGRLFVLVGIALYVFLLYWELTQLV